MTVPIVVAMVVAKTTQAHTTTISAFTVVKVVIGILACNTGPDKSTGYRIAMIDMVMNVMVFMFDNGLIDNTAAYKGTRGSMRVSVGSVWSDSRNTCHV